MNRESSSEKIRVFAVDDDPSVTWILTDGLSEDDFTVEAANDGISAMNRLMEFHPDVCLLDIKMPGVDGIELLSQIKRFDPTISVIMISGHADTPVVVQAMKSGAEDFLVKPFEVEMVQVCIHKVLEKKDLKQRVRRLEQELARESSQQDFIGESPPMIRVRELIEQVGPTDLNVIVRGETGTGKDVIARAIHKMSERHKGPFVKVNCAALPSDLLESELFGHERGSFTGAYKSKPGRFELADKGTIFLDEIGEMPPQLQAKLLQVLEHREFFRVGGTNNIHVNVRLVAATNINIEKKIQEQEFRVDLFYRMNDISIHLPPLRDRSEDIPLLAHFFLERYCEKLNKMPWNISDDSNSLLLTYPFPGNVRELESLIKRVVIFGEKEIQKHIQSHQGELSALAGNGQHIVSASSLSRMDDRYYEGKTLRELNNEVMGQVERRAIELCLDKHGWNRKKSSKDLGVSYRCLLYKIQEYDLKVAKGPAKNGEVASKAAVNGDN